MNLLFGISLVLVGACLGVLGVSLALSAHEEAPSRYLLGKCRDCRGAVWEGDDFVVCHVECLPAENVTPIESAGMA